jgi:hypothetical protein
MAGLDNRVKLITPAMALERPAGGSLFNATKFQDWRWSGSTGGNTVSHHFTVLEIQARNRQA